MAFLIGTYIGVFTGGPMNGQTMIVPTQDGALPSKLTFADYDNDNQVLVRPGQVFEAQWAQSVYELGIVVGNTAAYALSV